jgi:hypothetical protein
MGRQGSIEDLGKTALADPHRNREGRYVDIERRVAPIGPHQSKISSNARSMMDLHIYNKINELRESSECHFL